jgi:hypothetical protein
MADDNKRNALFSKLFSKEKKQEEPAVEADETASLDEIMTDEDEKSTPAEQNVPADNEDDDYEAWLTEAMTEEGDTPDEDISDALAELFGEDDNTGTEGVEAFDIPVMEDFDVAPDEVAEEYVPEELPEAEEAPAEEIPEYSEPAELEYEDEAEPAFAEEEPADEPAEDTPAPEIDEDTATLLTALGYTEGGANDITKTEHRPAVTRNKTTDLSLAYGYEGKEYMSHAQASSIKSAYSRDRFKMLIRLGGTVIFALLLFVYDAFGKSFGGVLDVGVYPVVHILISLQLLMIAAAFSVKQLFYGINSIFKAEPIVHSLSAAAVVITVLYDIVLAIVAPEAFTLYNFPAAICLLLGVIHDYFVLEREVYVFDRLSSWQSVATLERVDSNALATELGENRVGEAEHKIGQAFRMRRGSFAENYFRRINRRNPMAKMLNFIIAPVFALSLVVFIISLASDKTAIESFNAFLAVNLFSLPTFMLVAMSYPFFTLVSKNLNADSVIFSESDVSEYKKVDTVVFEESDLFDDTSLTINRISVCDKNHMQDVFDIMCGVSALYDRIGGRIAGVFRASTAEGDIPEDVTVIHVEDGGFEGIAGGRQYTVGSDAYLTSKGIAVMRYYDDKYIASNPGGVVLHIAVDGIEVFKLYLTYRISDSMLSVINELSLAKTRIVMRTVDPNINLELISRILTSTFDGKLTLVRKPYDAASEAPAEDDGTIEGGVLVNGENPESILDVVKACKLFGIYSKLSVNVSIVLFAVGVLLSVFLGVVGALAGMSSLYIVLFQILSVVPSFILANLLLK